MASAKRFWLDIIRRHAEPVPGSETRLRVRGSEEPDRGVILVEHGRPGVGPEEGAPAVALRQGELEEARSLLNESLAIQQELPQRVFYPDGSVGDW